MKLCLNIQDAEHQLLTDWHLEKWMVVQVHYLIQTKEGEGLSPDHFKCIV